VHAGPRRFQGTEKSTSISRGRSAATSRLRFRPHNGSGAQLRPTAPPRPPERPGGRQKATKPQLKRAVGRQLQRLERPRVSLGWPCSDLQDQAAVTVVVAASLATHFEDAAVRKSISLDLALLERYDERITDLELDLVRRAKQHDPQAFQRLRSIPGVGKVLALTILYEIHDIRRFDRVQEFASYARLVKCAKESGGKKLGTGGAKMGNVHLEWAFSEAAVLFVRHSAEGKEILARLEKRFGKGKALSILAHKLGRAA